MKQKIKPKQKKPKLSTLLIKPYDMGVRGTHYIIPMKVNGKTARMLLDTGASSSVMCSNGIKKYKLGKPKPTVNDITKAMSASGQMDIAIHKCKKMEMGKIAIKNSPITVICLNHINQLYDQFKFLPIDGIIGMGMLKELGAIIDLKTERIILQSTDKDYKHIFKDKTIFKV